MRILIVDDSKAMRMIVLRTLRQAGYGGHEMDQAANGVEALAAIEKCPFDLILCDWNMPEMSGLELLRELKARGSTASFGFVTSEGTGEMRHVAAEAGASFLIVKPFTDLAFQQALDPLLNAA